MQFIVVAPGSGVPQWNNLSSMPTDGNGNYSFNLVANQSFNLNMQAAHSDSTKALFLSAFSEVFNLPNSNATFIQTKSGLAKGTFNWQPATADIRKEPYIVVFRASDGYFTDDIAVLLHVNTALGNEELTQADILNIYPNPAGDHVFLQLSSDQEQDIRLEVITINGQKVVSNKTLKAMKETNVHTINTSNWNSGIYLVHISGSDGLKVQKMMIIE